MNVDEIEQLLSAPVLPLVQRAAAVHAQHRPGDVQTAALLSIKTGGCPEDCAYCPQSAHYAKTTGLAKTPLSSRESVYAAAKTAKDAGATRFCMGAAWRNVREGAEFDSVLDMVRDVRALGMEACVTLGMLTPAQAQRLADAGLSAYNHNLDTGPEFYEKIITTRTYDDRLQTLQNARDAGIGLCCGGIIGMGERLRDRAHMLHILAELNPPPESVPINVLEPTPGTPLADRPPVDPFDVVRTVAVARILMPSARVRLSAGRRHLSREAQALCFLAGADSIFFGDTLLTAANPKHDDDRALLRDLGLPVQESNACPAH